MMEKPSLGLTVKLSILLVISSLIPMLIFGIIAIITSIEANNKTVFEGNLSTARRAADQIGQYISGSISMIRALSENVSHSDLNAWQIERMFKNYAFEFERFKEISLFDLAGKIMATSSFEMADSKMLSDEARQKVLNGETYRSDVFVSEDFMPIMLLGLPVQRLGKVDGFIVVRLNLVAMWDLVDEIKVGKDGYVLVVSGDGKLIAHGLGEGKPDVLKGTDMRSIQVVQSVLRNKEGLGVYRNNSGVMVAGVSVPIRSLGWGLVIEQPTEEAFIIAKKLSSKLAILIFFILLLMVTLAYLGGRWQIMRPVNELMKGIKQISEGNLDTQVRILSGDEFQQLGDSFNMMVSRLKDLEMEIRRNERSVFFGKIAQGLVHDLRHPLRNIGNMSRLLPRMFNDESYRETFKTTVERELGAINRFLDDLHNLTHPAPLTMIGIELNRFIDEAIEPFKEELIGSMIELKRELSLDNIKISADRFALERVFKNIITNAIDAMPEGGILAIRTRSCLDNVLLEVSDTGVGIDKERLPFLFTDYQTTKRKGLGLGLAITKRLVEEMGDSISVYSTKGRGTTFLLTFPPFVAQ